MSAATEAFLAMLAAERGAAQNTLSAYARDLEQAEEAIGDLAEAGRDAVASLASAWADLAPASVARKASALRQFFGFAIDEGWRRDDPSGALPAPRTRRPLPKVLTHDHIAALFARAEEEARGDDPKAVRCLALIELLYGSGLRATELVSLPLSAVPRDAPFLTVTGKGGATGLSLLAAARWRRWGGGWRCARKCLPRAIFSRLAKAGTCPACGCSSCSGNWRQGLASIRPISAPMCCAMPLPRICWKAARTCVCCKPCSAMRTFPPRRSTPMSMPQGWLPSSIRAIRLQARQHPTSPLP